MLPRETGITFLTASVFLGLAPGPDNLFVLGGLFCLAILLVFGGIVLLAGIALRIFIAER